MGNSTTDTAHEEVPLTTAAEPASTPRREVVVERHVVQAETAGPAARQRGFVLPFLAGFATAIVAAALGITAFLAVSDSDDDGEIELDVPSVDLEVGG